MRYLFGLILFLSFFSGLFGFSPKDALKELVDGNNRYVLDKTLYADHSTSRRNQLLLGQRPFAIVLCCSDSRVIPEVIFDQSTGDLYVVRIAGDVLGAVELESIEFCAKTFGASLIFVLGHESCGAVKAVMENDDKEIGHIATLMDPAVKNEKNLDTAVKDNVYFVVNQIKNDIRLKKFYDKRKLDCAGGFYKIASGKVELLK
jgi:carbonic anhydrase